MAYNHAMIYNPIPESHIFNRKASKPCRSFQMLGKDAWWEMCASKKRSRWHQRLHRSLVVWDTFLLPSCCGMSWIWPGVLHSSHALVLGQVDMRCFDAPTVWVFQTLAWKFHGCWFQETVSTSLNGVSSLVINTRLNRSTGNLWKTWWRTSHPRWISFSLKSTWAMQNRINESFGASKTRCTNMTEIESWNLNTRDLYCWIGRRRMWPAAKESWPPWSPWTYAT